MSNVLVCPRSGLENYFEIVEYLGGRLTAIVAE